LMLAAGEPQIIGRRLPFGGCGDRQRGPSLPVEFRDAVQRVDEYMAVLIFLDAPDRVVAEAVTCRKMGDGPAIVSIDAAASRAEPVGVLLILEDAVDVLVNSRHGLARVPAGLSGMGCAAGFAGSRLTIAGGGCQQGAEE